MHNPIGWRDPHHLKPLVVAACTIVMLAGAAAVIWSRHAPTDARLVSLAVMRGAYDRVVPGRTSEKELAGLGFNTARFRSHALSQLGVQEYFMPATSGAFDRMDLAVRNCFDARDRCRALVFPLAADSGFMTAATGRMVFVLRHGRVTFKAVQSS
jgi:hypothetical protein